MPNFELVPFPSSSLPATAITGRIERTNDQLSIRYEVRGDIGQIHFPSLSTSPSRKDDLWKATCFEFFVAIKDQPQYWEFNMSLSGDWNVYVMDAYRQVNMREETVFTQLPFNFEVTNEKKSISLSVDLNPIIQREMEVDIGVTAIIQTKDGHESFWALSHPGRAADFHLRESFVIEL